MDKEPNHIHFDEQIVSIYQNPNSQANVTRVGPIMGNDSKHFENRRRDELV